MRRRHFLVLLAILLAWSDDVARAAPAEPVTPPLLEPPRQRQGYYLAAGLAGIANYNREDGAGLGVWTGAALTLRFGQLVTRRFGLGLQMEAGSSQKGTEQVTLFALAIEAQWELARHLAIHGAAGLGVVGISDTADPDAELRGAFGAGYALGASYDWFPAKSHPTTSGGFAITPFVETRLIPSKAVSALVGLIGVQATFWTGLPRNQLELPPGQGFDSR